MFSTEPVAPAAAAAGGPGISGGSRFRGGRYRLRPDPASEPWPGTCRGALPPPLPPLPHSVPRLVPFEVDGGVEEEGDLDMLPAARLGGLKGVEGRGLGMGWGRPPVGVCVGQVPCTRRPRPRPGRVGQMTDASHGCGTLRLKFFNGNRCCKIWSFVSDDQDPS